MIIIDKDSKVELVDDFPKTSWTTKIRHLFHDLYVDWTPEKEKEFRSLVKPFKIKRQ